MDNLTTEQKIARLEKELAALREKARVEKEENAKKARAEREQDWQKIKDALAEFNRKYDTTYKLCDYLCFSNVTVSPYTQKIINTFLE